MKQYLTLDDILEMFDVGRSTLWKWRKLGEFPAGKRLPNGQIRWRYSEVDAWFTAL